MKVKVNVKEANGVGVANTELSLLLMPRVGKEDRLRGYDLGLAKSLEEMPFKQSIKVITDASGCFELDKELLRYYSGMLVIEPLIYLNVDLIGSDADADAEVIDLVLEQTEKLGELHPEIRRLLARIVSIQMQEVADKMGEINFSSVELGRLEAAVRMATYLQICRRIDEPPFGYGDEGSQQKIIGVLQETALSVGFMAEDEHVSGSAAPKLGMS